MADNDVKIKLSLDGDKLVIDGLNGVGNSAAEADSKLGSFVSGGLKGTGVALATLGAAAVAGGAALSAAVISAYADAEQSVGGIETLFGEYADQMKAYAADAYATAGLSASEFMEQATGFAAALRGSLGEGANAAEAANNIMVAMSDNANKMGTDMGAIQDAYNGFAKQNYTMLDNLKLGYGGTQQEMQRLLDDASKLSGIQYDISSFADVSSAIQVIQQELGIAGTTAIEAESTISGSIGMLTGSFDNLLVAMGSANNESLAFLDVQEQAANVINSLETVVGNVAPIIESLGGALGTLGPQLGGMLEGLVGTVAAIIPGLLDAGIAMVGGLVQGISSALPSLITALIPGVISLVEMVVTQLPLLLDAGLQAVAALAAGLAEALPTLIPLIVEGLVSLVQTLIDNLPMLLDAGLQLVQGLASGLIKALPVLISALPTLILGLIDFIVGAIPQIIDAGMQLFLGLIGALPEIITLIVEAIPQILEGLIAAVVEALPLLIEGGQELFLGLIGALPEIILGIVAAIPEIVNGVLGAITSSIPQLIQAGVMLLVSMVQNLPTIISEIVKAVPSIITGLTDAIGEGMSDMVTAGGDLLRGLWEGISETAGWLWEKVSGWAGGLMDGVKDFFGIKSPSRRMRDEVGEELPAGVGLGIEDNEDAALDPMRDLNKKLTKEAKKLSGLNLSATVKLGEASTPVSTTGMMPAAYTPNAASFSPTVVVDTSALTETFERWLSSGAGRTVVEMTNNVSMFDRDPRIVTKQLGRGLEEALNA